MPTPPPESAVATAATNGTALPPPAAAAKVQPAPAAGETNVSAATPGPFDNIRLQGIFYRTGSPLAIINGKTVGVGDLYHGLRVVAIDRHSVTLALDGEQKIFKLN